MTGSKGAAKTTGDKAHLKRQAFLQALKDGQGIEEACTTVGWASMQSYYYNRKEWPIWRDQIDHVRAARGMTGASQQRRQMTVRRQKNGAPAGGGKTIEQVVDEFQQFTTRYFPDRKPHLAQQLRIVAELNNLRPREVCLFLVWPEAGKTSTFEDHICRTLALDPDHRFRIVSEAADLSKRIVGTCARRFTQDQDYKTFIRDFGPFYEKGQERHGRPWTTEQLTVLKNSGAERDRSLVASSWTSAVYGSRIDTLILDDIQSQRNFGQSEEIFRRIRGTFFNRGLEMRTLIVGTRIGPGDFYERMLDAGLVSRYVKLPAADVEGEPTVPEFWDQHTMIHDGGPCCQGFRVCPRDQSRLTSREFMELIRHQSGEDTWWSAYQQNPIADERSSFGRYLDGCKDLDRLVGQMAASGV